MTRMRTIASIMAVMVLTACNENMNEPDWISKEKSQMDLLLENFYASVHPDSRAENPFEIIGVSKKTYKVENDSAFEVFHEIAHGCQVKFACSGSSTTAKAAYRYLRDLNFDCTYSTGGIDVDRVKETLRIGIPHLIGGADGESGHMWIISGLRDQPYGVDFWCNWGWGGNSDGWSAGNPYTYKDHKEVSHAFPKNLKQIYINSK